MKPFMVIWALLLVFGAMGLVARSFDHASSATAASAPSIARSDQTPSATAIPALTTALLARQQSIFAQEVERIFLRNGITIDVNVVEIDPKGYVTPYLHFFGYMSKAMIFQLLENGKLLQAAKKIGFRGVDFQSKVDGHYFFDLTGDDPIPHCAQFDRVCW